MDYPRPISWVTSIGFGVVLNINFSQFILFLLYTVFVDTIIAGIIVSTILWFLANRFLRRQTCLTEDVEWGYAFDVHLNAFFPPLIILHFFQLFFYSWLLSSDAFISLLFGNLLWALSIGYYIFITFLGYSALPILEKTRCILYAIPGLVCFFLLAMVFRWNLCSAMMHFYYQRIV